MENITLGREGVSDMDGIAIAEEVGLDKLINSFEDGYNHVILNSSRIFSGTDRVRMLVARALIGQPRLVLTEDLFSGLREDNRVHLLDLLMSKCQNTTLVMVSNNKEIQSRFDTRIEL